MWRPEGAASWFETQRCALLLTMRTAIGLSFDYLIGVRPTLATARLISKQAIDDGSENQKR
jgi:hypothetical protein